MRFTKLDIIEGITFSLGVSGAIAVIIGGASCLGGLTATGIIKAGEYMASNRPTYQKMMFYGGVSAGAGLFVCGVGVGIAKAVGEHLAEEEYQQLTQRLDAAKSEKAGCPRCQGCKYLTGNSLLPCAVHPTDLIENCPDWAEY